MWTAEIHYGGVEPAATLKKKRGRPAKYGVAMSPAERQRRRRERLKEKADVVPDTRNALTRQIAELRAAVVRGETDIADRLAIIEAAVRRMKSR